MSETEVGSDAPVDASEQAAETPSPVVGSSAFNDKTFESAERVEREHERLRELDAPPAKQPKQQDFGTLAKVRANLAREQKSDEAVPV